MEFSLSLLDSPFGTEGDRPRVLLADDTPLKYSPEPSLFSAGGCSAGCIALPLSSPSDS